ncbi:transcriptional regulator GlxA family with amidase domain [Bradyrhizobium japonicum]
MRRQRDAALQGFIARVQSNQFVIYITAMDDQTDQIRKPRADAVRNRERVLEAAKVVFNAGGPEASLEAVAKRAGVGIGTLYRHFPTREDLFRGGVPA